MEFEIKPLIVEFFTLSNDCSWRSSNDRCHGGWHSTHIFSTNGNTSRNPQNYHLPEWNLTFSYPVTEDRDRVRLWHLNIKKV